MGWMERLFGGMGRKDSAVGSMVTVRRVGQAVWTPRTYKAFAKEGYAENVIAYRCIRLISECVAAIPFLLYEGDDELEDHPFLKVLSRPNPWQSGAEMIDAFVSYYLIGGNGYIEAVDLDGEIRELYTLRPDRMTAIAGRRGHPQGWQYSVDGTAKHLFDMDLRPEKSLPISPIRHPYPLDDFYGLSPIGAAAKSIDVFNSAGAYNKALLDNSASPSGALVYKGTEESDATLSDDQFRRLKSELEARHQGSKNAGRPMLLEGGLEWQPMGMSPKDLEFTDGKREAAREIALAFGVPPQLLGIPGDNTYSNYQEANRAFHRQRILPLMDRICDGLSNWVQPSYPNARIDYDVDQIDALSIEREAVWTRVKDANFITTDEKRDAVGYDPYEAGETPGSTILVGGAQVPLDDAGFAPGGEEPPVIADPDADAE